ncbi:MAG: hypothetical protein B6243_00090 [Anaerolineaceae bacterium 4572_5.2]|nr:MAG: hypothetical protein B6243_00090 [Anaerolineaceae bacterium 4572_5.2]
MFDFLTPEKATLIAQETHLLAILLAIVGVIAVALVYISIYRSAVKYKRGSDTDRSKQPSEDSRKQIAHALIIFIVLLMIFVLSADTFLRAITPPNNTLEIAAVGKRWMWKFQHHPDGQREINELHVPIGRPVKLTMTSQDVAHSLSIPALGVQQAVMPDHYYTNVWFEVTTVITKPGDYKAYRLMGGQYNGTAYSQMTGNVIALTPADYQLWLEGEYIPGGPPPTPVEKGQGLFEKSENGCSSCHLADGNGLGPWFADRYGASIELDGGGTATVDDAYLAESIIDPKAKIVADYTTVAMPSYEFSDEELSNLIAYLKSLSGAAGDEATGPAVPAEMPEAYTLQGCGGCHGVNMEGGTGPILVGLDVDYIIKEAREGNEELGMTPYGPDLIKDSELEQMALFMNAATMEYTGLELSEGVIEKLQLVQEPLAAEDKDSVEAALIKVLEATIINKSPLGLQNTIKTMITSLELDNWAEYTGWRLASFLGEP